MDYQKDVQCKYNEIADDYSNHTYTEEVISIMKPYYELFSQYVKEGMVYDLGCGAGRDTYQLSLKGLDIRGLDFSNEMIRVANRNFPSLSFQLFNIVKDVSNLELSNGLWASASLLHLKRNDFIKVMGELHTSLSQNGYFYISMKITDTYTQERNVNGLLNTFYTIADLDDIFYLTSYITIHQSITYREKDNTEFIHYILQKL